MADCCCQACGQTLQWTAPGVYECDICTVAHREGKSITEVRREVEALAHSFGTLMGGEREAIRTENPDTGDRGVVCLEPEGKPPRFKWPRINREQVAWEREHVAATGGSEGG